MKVIISNERCRLITGTRMEAKTNYGKKEVSNLF